jgi:hypothetical protein
MSEIGAILVVTAIAIIPIAFAIRCGGAIFSSSTRERISGHAGTHIIWGLAAGLAVAYFVVGNIMTRRMVEDYQRRMAEQNIRQVSPEAAPSASPDEPSM